MKCFATAKLTSRQDSFLDHVYLGCTQRECKISDDIATNNRDMFESRISAGAKEKLPTRAPGKLDAEIISSWSCDMEGHAKKCVERDCEHANFTTQQSYKVATPCMDDHQFEEEEEEEEWRSVGEMCKNWLSNCSNMLVFGTHW